VESSAEINSKEATATMSYRKMLCAVDFSDTTTRVFEAAVELAQFFGAKLHVLHVIEVDPRITDLDLEQKAVRAMEALVGGVQETLGERLTTALTTGRAFTEIVDRAKSGKFDLVVIGAKGLTLLEESGPGRTMEHVLKHAPCSVLVVRQ
jgi:nucleotide-binding universal stress UspA family protein